MKRATRPLLLRYALAIILSFVALGLTVTISPVLTRTTFAFFYVAVLVTAWFGGFGPAALATALGLVYALYFVIPPVGTFMLSPEEAPNFATFLVVSLFFGVFASARERAAAQAHAEREQLQVTLSSIGDGVIVTDAEGKIVFLNPVAQSLTGWNQEQAAGQPLAGVFNIVSEETAIAVEDPVAKVLRGGKTVGLGNHTLLIARDGSRLPIDDSAAPIRSKAGKITGVVLIFRDIRERRAAEKALQEGEERFRALIENSSDAIATLDLGGTVRYASASNAQVLGYAPEEMTGKNAMELLDSSDRESMIRVFEKVAASAGSTETGQFRFRHKDGSLRWLEGTARNLLAVPSVGGVVLNYRDITERVEAVQALRESRDELSVILRGVTEGITVQDPGGRLVYANDMGARLMGYETADELLSVPTENILARFEMRDESGELLSPARLPGRAALAGHSAAPLLTRFRERATGLERWAQVEAAPVLDSDGRVRFAINIFRDITERKQYEQRLALQHSVSRLLSDAPTLDAAAPHLLLAIGETLAWDAAAFWEVEPEAGKLRSVANWHSPQIHPTEFEGLAERTLLAEGVGLPGRVWQSHSGMWLEDFAGSRYLRAAEAAQAGLKTAYALPVMLGSEVLGVIELFTRTRRPEEPEMVTLLGTVAGQVGQFVQRQRAQEAVRDSEDRMRTIAETASDGIITIDSESRILFVNQAIGQIFGYSSDELQDKSLSILMPREAREMHFASLKRYIHTGQKRQDWTRIEMSGRRKDGSSVPLEISLGEFVKNGKHFFTGVIRDVSVSRAAEDQMRFQAGILQNVRDAIVVCDLQGKILYWNSGAEQVYGYSAEEMQGQALSLLYPETDEDKLLDGLHRLLSGGDDQGEFRGRRKDGRDVWVNVKTTVLRNRSGRATGFIQVSQDITERHQTGLALATSEERFRSLSANSPIGIFLADIDGKITYTNPAFRQMLAITAEEEAAGDNWMALVHPDDTRQVTILWRSYIQEGRPFDSDVRTVTKTGEQRWLHIQSSPMFSDREQLLGHVGTSEDITERKQTQQALEFLAEASSALAASLDYRETLKSVARLAVPRLADWCIVDMLGEDGILRALEVAHVDPEKVRYGWELREQYPIDMNAPAGAPNVMRTGRPELYPEIPDDLLRSVARNEEEYNLMRDIGYRSIMIVPLMSRGRPLGAISFVLTESVRRFGASELGLAEELARRAATAIDNAVLYRAEQGARRAAERATDRIGRLQAVTAALAEAVTPEEVSSVVVSEGRAALGASAGFMGVWMEAEKRLHVLRTSGYSPDVEQQWRVIPGDAPVPSIDAMRTGRPVWIASRSEMRARYPGIEENHYSTEFEAYAVVPLVLEQRTLGCLGLSFDRERVLTPEDRELILTMSRQAAEALERARLFQAEQQARAQAEQARERVAFLSEASQRLAWSLEPELILQTLASLAVPLLADWCTVDVITEEGNIRMAARAHADPEKVALIDELNTLYPLQPDAPYGYPHVIKTGEPSFIPDPSPADLDAITEEEAHRQLIRRLGFTSHQCVPLTARGRTFGAVTLNLSQIGRCYTREDLALALEFARRGAVALDNARLYREQEQAVSVRDEFLSIASHELKTPLTSLMGYAEILKRSGTATTGLSERDRRAVDVIAAQSVRLNKLINSMLDLSRIQSGRLTIERTRLDLVELARRVVDNTQLVTDRHEIKLIAPDGSLMVDADELRLEQVLENLIQNAIKYSPRGGPIEVRLARDGETVCMAVTDQGVGISEAEMPRLFTRFYRIQSGATRHISGMGVGLYVVKEIMNAHGGSIEVQSREGEGSTFTACLPASVTST